MESEPHRRKLEETVIGILKNADLESATEASVRNVAAELLGVDLSDLESKRLVRRVVESFLLCLEVEQERGETKEVGEVAQPENLPVDDQKPACDDGDGLLICKLSTLRSVSIQKFKGTTLVSFREYWRKRGKMFPSGRGISLNRNQWLAFRASIPDIEGAIVKMESRIRAEGIRNEQTEAEASASLTDLVSEQHVSPEKTQTGVHTSGAASLFPPRSIVPIVTTRLNGKNYYCWKHQMEFFLNQLQISYVLTETCPTIPVSAEATPEEISQAKVDAQKWVDNDYVCCHNILYSLSDQLFDEYSGKSFTARELWEELKLTYADDFGTKRSYVNNYIQFQMVDGVSVIEQTQELHRIAESVTASGIHIDENFHVGAIVSKLPPSWKDFRMKLLQEEHLIPLDKLIYRLKDEEELRIRLKKEGSKKRKRDMKGLCYGCGKEGHIRRDCPSTNFKKPNHGDQSNTKESNEIVANVVPLSSTNLKRPDHGDQSNAKEINEVAAKVVPISSEANINQ